MRRLRIARDVKKKDGAGGTITFAEVREAYQQWIDTALVKLGYDVNNLPFDREQITFGLKVELEHGRVNPVTNITDNDPIMTLKIVLAHLSEDPQYYIPHLKDMEENAKKSE